MPDHRTERQPAPAPTTPPTAPELSRDQAPCADGQAWTCTMQCDAGTRDGVDRIFGAPGAEACVVLSCSCQAQVVHEGASIGDPTLPIALVIFGVRGFLRR